MPKKKSWRTRERERFKSGEYKPVAFPRPYATKRDHFLHMSQTNPQLVAYTPDPAAGERGKKAIIKPGRYLKKYWPDLHDERIAALVERLHGFITEERGFAITHDPSVVKRVYLNGPSSCMSGRKWELGYHLMAPLAGPDLGLAYIQRKDGRILGRSWVWPAKKLHWRVYGSSSLAQLLKQEGYTSAYRNGKRFTGARITKLPHPTYPEAFLLPYLDGLGYGFSNLKGKKYFKIGSGNSRTITVIGRWATSGDPIPTEYRCQTAGCYRTRVVDNYCVECARYNVKLRDALQKLQKEWEKL